MYNYYATFVCHYTHMAVPIYELLRKDEIWGWIAETHYNLAVFKRALCKASVQKMADFNKPFVMKTDASKVAVDG